MEDILQIPYSVLPTLGSSMYQLLCSLGLCSITEFIVLKIKSYVLIHNSKVNSNIAHLIVYVFTALVL